MRIMTVYVSGGCKSGKSTHAEGIAQKLSAGNKPLYYIATMVPSDGEDELRIERHRKNRAGMGFETVELPRDIGRAAEICDMSGTFLLDSVTALLANEMFRDGAYVSGAGEKVAAELSKLLETASNIVLVSDYIYSDAVFYDEYTENYIKSLAEIDKTCAKLCDSVLEACCGCIITHKGVYI
jgi:adenosylcobinamide kinase/adenosylcobinamide-phosphate guanylyltransferase